MNLHRPHERVLLPSAPLLLGDKPVPMMEASFPISRTDGILIDCILLQLLSAKLLPVVSVVDSSAVVPSAAE